MKFLEPSIAESEAPASARRRYGIVLPACEEEACIGEVLRELRGIDGAARFVVAVGVNGSSDRTAEIAREEGAVVGETARRGYGHGCMAAIDALEKSGLEVDAYIFCAADGANDPRDIPALVAAFETGAEIVVGSRTRRFRNWRAMNFHYVLVNFLFGFWVGLLTGRFYSDLGPLRIIGRHLFQEMKLREWTYGWTIEAQVRAGMLGARAREIPVVERLRIAGEQKVSRVSAIHSAKIGFAILAAGWRTRVGDVESAPYRKPGAVLADRQ